MREGHGPTDLDLARPHLGTRNMQAGGAFCGEGSGSQLRGMNRTGDVLGCRRGGWGPHIPVLRCGKDR